MESRSDDEAQRAILDVTEIRGDGPDFFTRSRNKFRSINCPKKFPTYRYSCPVLITYSNLWSDPMAPSGVQHEKVQAFVANSRTASRSAKSTSMERTCPSAHDPDATISMADFLARSKPRDVIVTAEFRCYRPSDAGTTSCDRRE